MCFGVAPYKEPIAKDVANTKNLQQASDTRFFFTKVHSLAGELVLAVATHSLQVHALLVFLNAYRNNPQAHRITIVALHPSSIQGIMYENVSGGNHNLRENQCKPKQKNHLNSQKKSHM